MDSCLPVQIDELGGQKASRLKADNDCQCKSNTPENPPTDKLLGANDPLFYQTNTFHFPKTDSPKVALTIVIFIVFRH